jgi:hypothetical protein
MSHRRMRRRRRRRSSKISTVFCFSSNKSKKIP